MGMNSLQNLAEVLETGAQEIAIDQELCEEAVKPIKRMLEFAKEHEINMKSKGNA
jgi:quinolinate synthase